VRPQIGSGGIGSGARRLLVVGIGAAVYVLLGALPAPAATVVPVTSPPLPPVNVAPGPIEVGPVTLDPQASLTPTGAVVGVTTDGLPLPDGGPAIGVELGSDGARAGVGGVDAGVTLSPPLSLAPVAPLSPSVSSPLPASVASQPRVSGEAARSVSPGGARAAPMSSSASAPKVVALVNRARREVSGGIDSPRHRTWWSLATAAARSYLLWIVLLAVAFVIRSRVGAAWHDQRGVRVARSV
jgi:hypothetical protein